MLGLRWSGVQLVVQIIPKGFSVIEGRTKNE